MILEMRRGISPLVTHQGSVLVAISEILTVIVCGAP